ncbi:WhiB family transcriptional regulator [Streptomyces sp. Ag109_O5-1]|uniref:WhiB family transcriptional regulator n=1 Tax=Streptomyces sp. Ag109_O5-1 TaxID=1938851 RepID=UPI0021A938AC|nr:WhiB family transcriptional regulator [Streptomyces sp. Ag109_O5-1]
MTALPEEEEWRHEAACRQEDPELFFPVGTSVDALVQTRQAKAVCAGCSERLACLAFALDTDQRYGVWGGLSEDERRAMKRRSNKLKGMT